MLKFISVASPRTEGAVLLLSSMVMNFSAEVWRLKVDGESGTGITRKDSEGETAGAEALRMPYLSQLRYLGCILAVSSLVKLTNYTNGCENAKTYRPWCPFKLKLSVPATRFATHTCLTSCGSAVAISLSMKFSTAIENTLPLASHDIQLPGSVGSTMIIGPDMSLGASAVTQLSSEASLSLGCA